VPAIELATRRVGEQRDLGTVRGVGVDSVEEPGEDRAADAAPLVLEMHGHIDHLQEAAAVPDDPTHPDRFAAGSSHDRARIRGEFHRPLRLGMFEAPSAAAPASFQNGIPMYPGPINRLVSELAKLPGIGQRTAQRLAFHVLREEETEALALSEAIREVKEKIGLCEVCFNLSEGQRCQICDDPRRDRSLICVVEQPADVIPIERTHEYRGLYHVLGGALSPIDGIDPDDLRITELVARIEGGEAEEVVLATNPTTTGEATAHHLAELLRGKVTITRLASGLPVGADLEHADEVTLGRAFAGRRTFD
jgi:recombination protein RecR